MTFRLLLAVSLVAPLAAACADQPVEDEFAIDDVVDVDDSKADIAGGTYTFFTVERDFRKCSSPMCGGWWIDRVNASDTKCHDGRYAERCYVAELDFARLGLGEEALARVTASTSLLMRGTVARVTLPAGVFGRFRPTEAWLGQGPNVAEGPFAMVEETGVRCFTTPCPTWREKKLNSSATASLAEIGWDASGATDEQIGAAIGQIFTNNVIIAGERYTVTGPGGTGKARTATQFYTRAVDTRTCFVGGCSGQICSDQEGMVSTCEWREEYACYQDATCEAQADGECGWTETEELVACLSGTGS